MIKFDLHIHSKASEYKENKNIVEKSDIKNLDVLMQKLTEHNIELFSITDHNRFNIELYKKVDELLQNKSYPVVKNILAGVEFDVQIDDQMGKCHIIAIFDAKNDTANYEEIYTCIENDLLKDKEDYYDKNRFETLLKNIGLDTILIASQTKNIYNHNGKNNAISDSVKDVEHVIQIGYIQALEYQKPNVEGILKNNLFEIGKNILLVSGSDCHEWETYPHHSSNNKHLDFFHSKAKILPTFKGLLMAVTSPETRFNCRENTTTNSIKNFSINGEDINLVNGINTIIGENGSGKSTILKLLTNNNREQHVKKIIANNKMFCSHNIEKHRVKYIEQGDIIKKFNENTLFVSGEENSFKEINHSIFIESYQTFAQNIKKYIEERIDRKASINKLDSMHLYYKENLNAENYFIQITNNILQSSNMHTEPKEKLVSAIDLLTKLNEDSYFSKYKDDLVKAIHYLEKIHNDIKHKYSVMESKIELENIIIDCMEAYGRKIKSKSTSKDQERLVYQSEKSDFINKLLIALELKFKVLHFPDIPKNVQGSTKNPLKGFYFNKEAKYNNTSMLELFFEKMFILEYRDLEIIEKISSVDEFTKAIYGCTNSNDINTKWKENLSKFITEATKENEYITDTSLEQIGNTLGEMSISYYKYYTQQTDDWDVLVVDQPEDNISNNNISDKLITYFNSIRDSKQLIFVTHNPLLVVNLDSDNVVFVENDRDRLSITNGCLEKEDTDVNILDIVATNMDGGRDTIEKRLKVYGKSYKNRNE